LTTADFPGLVAQLGYAAAFRRQAVGEATGKSRLWFELRWTRPDLADPPLAILRQRDQRYRLVSFELVDTNH
jgi:hypothetical protein